MCIRDSILHCAGGYRSMIAASMLKQKGFDNFVDVIGGFAAIKDTNLAKTDYVCPSTLSVSYTHLDVYKRQF